MARTALAPFLLLALLGCPKAEEKTPLAKTGSAEASTPDPAETARGYLVATLRDHDFDAAYELLSVSDRETVTEEAYLKKNEHPFRKAFAELVFPSDFLGEITIKPVSEGKIEAVAEVTNVDAMKLILAKGFGRNLTKDEQFREQLLEELRVKAHELPRKTSKRSVFLVREDGAWKVWLNLGGEAKAEALRKEGQRLSAGGKPEEALATYRKALEVHPQSASATKIYMKGIEVAVHRKRAERALRGGKLDQAVAEGRRALDLAEGWEKHQVQQLLEKAKERKARTCKLGEPLRLGGVEVRAVGFGGLQPFSYKYGYGGRSEVKAVEQRCAVLALTVKNVSETMAIELYANAEAVDEFGNKHERFKLGGFSGSYQLLAGRRSNQKQITPGQTGTCLLYVEAPKIPKAKQLIWEVTVRQDNTGKLASGWVVCDLPPAPAARAALRRALLERAKPESQSKGLVPIISDPIRTPLDFSSATTGAPSVLARPASREPKQASSKTLALGEVLRLGGVEVCGLAFGGLRPFVFKRNFGRKAELQVEKKTCAVLALSVKNVSETMAIDLYCAAKNAMDEFDNKHSPYKVRSFSGSFQLLEGRRSEQKQLTPGQSGIYLLYVEAPKIKRAKRFTWAITVKTDNAKGYEQVTVVCPLPPQASSLKALRSILLGRARIEASKFRLPGLSAAIQDATRTPLRFD